MFLRMSLHRLGAFDLRWLSGRDVAFGSLATFEWSGTGALRSHFLFDLRRPDYASDAARAQTLKLLEREADLTAGRIVPTAPAKN